MQPLILLTGATSVSHRLGHNKSVANPTNDLVNINFMITVSPALEICLLQTFSSPEEKFPYKTHDI